MSFFEYFSSLNIPWCVYLFEYTEFFIGLVCCLFAYRAGRIGMSAAITIFIFLFKLIFDHFWLYFIYSLDYGGLKVELFYTGFAASDFLFVIFVYYFHLRLKVEFSLFVIIVAVCNIATMLLQAVTYVEVVFFEYNYMRYIYPPGIPLFNFIGVFSLLMGAYNSYRKSKAMPQRIPFSWE